MTEASGQADGSAAGETPQVSEASANQKAPSAEADETSDQSNEEGLVAQPQPATSTTISRSTLGVAPDTPQPTVAADAKTSAGGLQAQPTLQAAPQSSEALVGKEVVASGPERGLTGSVKPDATPLANGSQTAEQIDGQTLQVAAKRGASGTPVAQDGLQKGVVETGLATGTQRSTDAPVARGQVPIENPAISRAVQDPGKGSNRVERSADAKASLEAPPEAIVEAEASDGEDALQDRKKSEQRQDAKSVEQRLVDRQSLPGPNGTGSNTAGRVQAFGAPVADAAPQSSSVQNFTSVVQSTANREGIVERSALSAPVASTSQADAVARGTLNQITAALKNQPLLQKIELSLDPPELGRIEIQMEVAEMGMRATLAAERPGTTDMIRRQAELLIQQFDEAGFNDVSLSFGEFGSGKDDSGAASDELWLPESSFADTANASERPTRQTYAVTGMDMRL